MPNSVTGGCKCGRITYSGTPADAQAFRCYCRDCQQLTGAGHSEMFPLDRASAQIIGNPTEYEMKGTSGLSTYSVFCPDCGSPISRRSERMSDRIYVHAASLDDPKLHAPSMTLYSASAQPWDMPPE